MIRKCLILPALILVLGACSTTRKGGYYLDDGPHDSPTDVSLIQDPVPRTEPLSESGNQPYVVFGKTYRPMKSAAGYSERGKASWYGKKFHGKKTSSGEAYDMYTMSAAHKTLPLPCYVRVRNLDNNKSVIVRVNDRGPFLHHRLIDLSYAAAYKLDIIRTGTGRVEVTAINTARDTNETLVKKDHTGKPYLQVGSFSSYENAINLQKKLQAGTGHKVFIHNGELNNTTVYRVRIGPFADASVGQGVLEGIKDDYHLTDARLVFE